MKRYNYILIFLIVLSVSISCEWLSNPDDNPNRPDEQCNSNDEIDNEGDDNNDPAPVGKEIAEIHLEPVVLSDNGTGTFGDPPRALADESGNPLEELIHFAYDEPLSDGMYNIYDTGISGDLASGKYFRIVENGLNIADPAGLGLEIVAKNLEQDVSPPAGQCFVDPLRGRFILPRPVFWSRCENFDSLLSPVISLNGTNTPYFNNGSGGSITTSQDCIKLGTGGWSNFGVNTNDWIITTFHPFGKDKYISKKLTISFWLFISGSSPYNSQVNIWLNMTTDAEDIIQFWGYNWSHNIILDDSIVDSNAALEFNNIKHVYILIDESGEDLGARIRVYVNGAQVLSTNNSGLNIETTFFWQIGHNYSFSAVDNIKIWDHLIYDHNPSAPADWIYNLENPGIIDDGLHPVYGPDNDYKPKLDGEEDDPHRGGVGYYYTDE